MRRCSIPICLLLILMPLSYLWCSPSVYGELSVEFSLGKQAFMRPAACLGAFFDAVPLAAPEFYQLGGRLLLEPSSMGISLGARHNMYFVRNPSAFQELMAGAAINREREFRLLLSGRFGWSFRGASGIDRVPAAFPVAALVWSFGRNLSNSTVSEAFGISLGLAAEKNQTQGDDL